MNCKLKLLGKWGYRVLIKASGTAGLIVFGGITVIIVESGVSDIFILDSHIPTLKVAAGAAATQVILPALTKLAKKAKKVEAGEPPDLFGDMND